MTSKKKMYWSHKNITLDTFLKTLEMELDVNADIMRNKYIMFDQNPYMSKISKHF